MTALKSLEQIANPVASVSADGAYDTKAVYEAAHERGEGRAVRVLIPPGRDAQLGPNPSIAQKERNRNIRSIRELGRREWHTSPRYSRRSMVEKHRLPVQDDHRSKYAKSDLRRPTSRGTARV